MKTWIIVAVCLVLAGAALFAVAMSANDWDFTKLSTTKYIENVHEISEPFENIYIDTDTADVTFYFSEGDVCRVVCEEEEKLAHSVTLSDGTLNVKLVDNKAWYEHIGISFGEMKISVYLPKSEYAQLDINSDTGDVLIPSELSFKNVNVSLSTGRVKSLAAVFGNFNVKTSTGDVTLEKASVGEVDIKVSTGRVSVSDVVTAGDVKIEVSTGKTEISGLKCKNLISDGDTGRITLKDVVAEERFDIERSTGDVIFEGCDAGEIYVDTDTGDVSGTLLSDKVFIVKTDTGKIDVPNSISGGRCEIETDTGDVKISIG
ncbi:MAG: DUF4097 family beta strand repeat protein [Clostridia bacterium]|nr:DUF4097 family beta strand repeat protein [Clostridia bacterium]